MKLDWDQQKLVAHHCKGNVDAIGGSVNMHEIATGINLAGDSDDYERIAHLVADDPKYIFSRREDGHFLISRNPAYKKPTFPERHPFWFPVGLSILSAALSLLVGWLLLRSSNQSQYQIDKQQDSAIKEIDGGLKNAQYRLDTLR
jgi:hypothetical protein